MRHALVRGLRQFFRSVRVVKPRASRKESIEVYAVARGYDPEAFDASRWRLGVD